MNRIVHQHKRGSGALLHITSLPSPYGIGDLGPEAYAFIDFLKQLKQTYWQILPLNPTDSINSHSPYSSYSAFANNPVFISPDLLVKDGLISPDEISGRPTLYEERVDFSNVYEFKERLFQTAFERFEDKGQEFLDYEEFIHNNSSWLDDFALFFVLKEHFQGNPWDQWPEELKTRNKDALEKAEVEFAKEIRKVKFLQYVFYKQWFSLKDYCRKNNVAIIGDLPFYVTYDSVDVWAYPQFYRLDKNGKPAYVAGVPPDYFSATGQRWGNPVYDWDALKQTNYDWWIQRIKHNLKLFDYVRIDHFRGFASYWEIPSQEKLAVHGRWVKAPGEDFFSMLVDREPNLQIIAEDLGYITPDVTQLKEHFDLLGMKVLQFAFGDDMKKNPYLPHNYSPHCVVYTGTHDNNTTRGWFRKEATEKEKKNISRYLGHEVSEDDINVDFVQLAMTSNADIAIFPLQDLLGLKENSRMNQPGTIEGNWRWRLKKQALKEASFDKFIKMVEETKRI